MVFIVGVVPLWGDCPMRLSHSEFVLTLRLSPFMILSSLGQHGYACAITRGTFAVVCVLVDVGVHLDTFVGGPRRPPFK